jgi:probable rRNA maturation factor
MPKVTSKNLDHKHINISVRISDDAEIKKLNKEYLGRDFATDVLSFNVDEKLDDGTFYLGDIIVNKEQAERQALEYDNSLEEEISELVAHGVLHLLGVHHHDDDEHSIHGIPVKK